MWNPGNYVSSPFALEASANQPVCSELPLQDLKDSKSVQVNIWEDGCNGSTISLYAVVVNQRQNRRDRAENVLATK